MEKYLLTTLLKYAPRSANSPNENFLTGAFTWVLQNDRAVESVFLDFLKKKSPQLSQISENDTGEWSTQETLKNNKRPDITCNIAELKIIIEVKLNSPLHENQLKYYREGSDENTCIVLLTKTTNQHTQEADIYLTWGQVYNELKKIPEKSRIACELIALIRYLIPAKYITGNFPWFVANFYNEVRIFNDKMKSDFTTVKDNMNQAFHTETFLTDVRWGKNGVTNTYSEDDWFPGMFTGLIENPDDHCIQWINNQFGLPFVFMISVNISKIDTDSIRDLPEWLSYKQKLIEIFLGKNEGWQVYDAQKDAEAREVEEINKWHTFFIFQPFTDILNKYHVYDNMENVLSIADILTKICKEFFEKALNIPEYTLLKNKFQEILDKNLLEESMNE